MLKNLLMCGLVLVGLTATAGESKAYFPRYGYAQPYYGYRYYATPTAGVAYSYSGYGPYYNYGYRYYNYAPVVYPAYQVYPAYPAANYYYGPRVGFSYVTPRVGLYIGY